MISPQEYIEQIKERFSSSSVIKNWTITREELLPNRGHFRVRLSLKNDDFVEVSEYFSVKDGKIIQQSYRYQWMDTTKTILKRRWDNAPHFPEISTYPHHVHVDREDNVMTSHMFGIAELIDILETILEET
jgi:hypothetical protein